MTPDRTISVVMPVYNGADTLEAQLAALVGQDYAGRWELVIADNGSDDGSVDLAAAWVDRLPSLRVVDASARRGGAAADNIGAEAAIGSVLVFCDQDDIVQPGWLTAMASALEDHDFVVGRNEFASLNPMEPHAGAVRAAGPSRPGDQYGFLPFGLSCNLGVIRGVFEAVGGFDEDMPGADDVDLCWRIQLAGYPMRLEPSAVVAKRRRTTTGGVWRQHFNYGAHDVMLYGRFARQGMPRQLRRAGRRYVWLAVHVVDLARPLRRRSWVRVAAAQAGRLVGSVRSRTLYP